MFARALAGWALLLGVSSCGGEIEAQSPATEATVRPIFFGTDVEPGRYPWLTKTRNCTGALISPWYVLTAAHCYGYAERNAEGTLEGIELIGGPVRVGHPDLASREIRAVAVRDVLLHPEYIELTRDEVWGLEPFDIALLELAEPVYLDDYLRLPERQPEEGELLLAAGWGQTEEGFLTLAREAVLQVRERRSCFGGDQKRFCSTSGPDHPGSNVGGGDSGGPVFVPREDGFMVLGTNSTSNRDAPNTFASHAATFAFMDWVLQVTDGHFHCPDDDPINGCIALVDECGVGLAGCSDDATCRDEIDGFSCECRPGYEGDGLDCVDVDECSDGSNPCSVNAQCSNTEGSFSCACLPGFVGDGFDCADVDECADGSNDCSANAQCTNTPGSFACACRPGFAGDGSTCEDVDECTDGSEPCSPDALCTNTVGGFSCECVAGFSGDGTSCTADEIPTEGCTGAPASGSAALGLLAVLGLARLRLRRRAR